MRITEKENPASAGLDRKSTREILQIINVEDQKVAVAVRHAIPQITRAVDLILGGLRRGGRMIYLGAGTSGRLGILDASECVPTFGTDRVVAVMAGAPNSMFRPIEGAEDDGARAVRDLRNIKLNSRDVFIGISASGRTPYTLAGLRQARRLGAKTVGITCNPKTPMHSIADVTIAPVVGPEVIAGSTRMKAGTAQKLVLNMLSTASMIRVGRVLSGWMINVRMNNEKLRKRGEGILAQGTGVTSRVAARTLEKSGWNLPAAFLMLWKNIPRRQANRLLDEGGNPADVLRRAHDEWAATTPIDFRLRMNNKKKTRQLRSTH